MRRLYSPAYAFFLFFASALCLVYSKEVIAAVSGALLTFARSVFPALFPFFVLSSLLFDSGALHSVGRCVSPLFRVFRLPQGSGAVFLMGAVSGYPVGAKLSGELLKRGELSQKECERLAGCANLPGPMFVAGTIAASFLGAPGLGLTLALSQVAGAILTLTVTAPFSKKLDGESVAFAVPPYVKPSVALASALTNGMTSMLKVCGAIVAFAALVAALKASGVFSLMTLPARAAGMDKAASEAILTAFFEKTSGCVELAALSLPLSMRAAMCTFAAGFGGCSILAQTLCFAGVSPLRYWGYKLLQAGFASCVAYIAVSSQDAVSAFAHTGVSGDTPSLLLSWMLCTSAAAVVLIRTARKYADSSKTVKRCDQ